MEDLNKVRATFDRWALNGKANQVALGHAFAIRKILAHMPFNQPFSFIDVGCGDGLAIREIAENKFCLNACGIDISPRMVDLAFGKKVQKTEEYLCADFCSFANDKKFDILFSMETIYYIHRLEEFMNRMNSVLTTNGMFFIGMDFYSENYASIDWPQRVGLPMIRKTITEWVALFVKFGFRNVAFYQIKNPDANEWWQRECGTLVVTGKNFV